MDRALVCMYFYPMHPTHLNSTFALLTTVHLAESQLTRKTPPSYSDGVYRMSGHGRPSPRTLSQAFMKGQEGMGSVTNRTALATFFGKTLHIHAKTLHSH